MNFNLNNSLVQVTTRLKNFLNETVSTYSIKFESGVEEYQNVYTIRYGSTSLIESVNSYPILYSSLYGDVTTQYSIKYHSGRELGEENVRYTVKYSSTYPTEYLNMFSLIYTTTGPTELTFRSIYRFRYASEGVDEVIRGYNIKYGLEYFKERSQKYHIKFSSDTPYMFDTKAIMLRNNTQTSALFYLKGRSEDIENMLFVFSNLPRYQLVEFSKEKQRPHVKILDVEDVKDYNLFGENFESFSDTYKPACYIVVHNIDEVQNMSLDVYDKTTLQKRNINKSFFFDLNSTEFYTNPVSIDSVGFEVVNYSSNYYKYEYLNFVEKSVTPLFKVYDSCCFNTKITDTSSNACSPF